MTNYAAAHAAGISEESARRFRNGERPASLSFKVRDALLRHLAQLSAPPRAPSAPGPAVEMLLRAFRLQQWEAAGRFAYDVFRAAVDEQDARVRDAMAEGPPDDLTDATPASHPEIGRLSASALRPMPRPPELADAPAAPRPKKRGA